MGGWTGGEIWASALWEVYWNYVDLYGFEADLLSVSGGNNRALQVVTDALTIQPCNPTMVEGRDALLAADLANTGGANECLIWNGFGKRGLGQTASDGGGSANLNVTEDFSVPVQCLPEPGRAAMLLAGGGFLVLLSRRRPLS